MAGPEWAGPLFRQIAVPRLPGSPAAEAVTTLVAERLGHMGYQVERQRFRTSWHRLAAASAAGAGLGLTALLLAPLLVLPLPGWPVALVGAAALGVVALVAFGLARGHLSVGLGVVEATNLVARRGVPTAWLVAHADSKAQPFSLRARLVATGLAAVGIVALLSGLVARVATPLPVWWPALVLCAAVGGALLSRSAPRDVSPGAVDNAAGVVAALTAADVLRERGDVGVLITGAEEYGLEGARAWVAQRPAPAVFVNFDGLDSRGPFRVFPHRGPYGGRGGGKARTVSTVPTALISAVALALAETGARVRTGRLPPGVLVDGMVLARAGLAGITVSRGDWQTLGVIHTRRDTVERAGLEAAVTAGEAVARALGRLLS